MTFLSQQSFYSLQTHIYYVTKITRAFWSTKENPNGP